MGILDVVGYASFATGLPLCGAAVSSTISAATNQLVTALLSWAVLSRQLSRGQLFSVSFHTSGQVTHESSLHAKRNAHA